MKRLFWQAPKRGQKQRSRPAPAARTGPRRPSLATALVILASTTATLLNAAASSANDRSGTHAAHIVSGTATAHLHLLKANGSQLYEEGPVTGALPGSMHAVLTTGTTFAGTFTIHTHGSTINGRGNATTHGSGRYQSFSGTIIITGGNGRYSHAHGHTALSGTFDRRTYAITIKTTGSLTY
jgi:hypothetical protein